MTAGPSRVSFTKSLPATGPAVVGLAGTMLDPALVFSRLVQARGTPVISADWINAAGPDGLRSAAAALADALAASRREPVVLLGHSSGGAIALMLAASRPELVSGLLLANTGANTRGHGDPDAPKRIAASGLTGEVVDGFIARCFAEPPAPDVRHGLRDYALACSLDCVVAAMTSQRATDLEPSLPDIRCPTVVVHGVKDAVRTRQHVDVLLRGIRGSTVVEAQCGHTPPLEAPGVVLAALAGLLRRISAAAPAVPA